MNLETIPGRPIHVRVAGDHVLVVFDAVPWQFRVDDVAAAIQAFSCNDWAFFQSLWWETHDYLNEKSEKLALLVSHISPDELYSPSRIISLGSFLGYYGPWDLSEMERDYQRLTLAPILLGWPREGLGKVAVEGEEAAPAWLGHMWLKAIASASLLPDVAIAPVNDVAFRVSCF